MQGLLGNPVELLPALRIRLVLSPSLHLLLEALRGSPLQQAVGDTLLQQGILQGGQGSPRVERGSRLALEDNHPLEQGNHRLGLGIRRPGVGIHLPGVGIRRPGVGSLLVPGGSHPVPGGSRLLGVDRLQVEVGSPHPEVGIHQTGGILDNSSSQLVKKGVKIQEERSRESEDACEQDKRSDFMCERKERK